ncbi:unnamed protein product [Phytophthora fragariaefolia]|uniref:Unnamed protein product n=1 Tax=Phytophthora fragariaefolia TaxID=1490495 RepID=A0A9W6Y5A9_9STRA|nr:unnamed protein product [Phytophthora fragariaefolia]
MDTEVDVDLLLSEWDLVENKSRRKNGEENDSEDDSKDDDAADLRGGDARSPATDPEIDKEMLQDGQLYINTLEAEGGIALLQ